MVLSRLLQLVMASMWLGSSFAQKVAQAQPAVWVQEKEVVSLHCTYESSSSSYGLLWYKQPSSGEMVFLILQNSYSQENATQGRYSLSLQTASKSVQLVITASQLEDSAVYFCALRDDTVGELLEAVVQKPRVCLRHPPGVGTKEGNGHPDRMWPGLWQLMSGVGGKTLTLRKPSLGS
ncbi:T-cell receptor alpha chain V region HPB-MLT [Sciurus carolinensis]|nr:T-cell receptor alpha chain V region HPB-MLT [Sciurus carolinensis]